MAIEPDRETRQRMIASIRRFFAEELDQDIGDLKAMRVLDFVLREIGPSVYNLAVRDAQIQLQDRVLDLEGSCYEPEFRFWDERDDRTTS